MTVLDYIVVGVYLAGITAFGSWLGRFHRTTADYFLTGRSVPGWAICCTTVATETSTLSFIGVPAAAYAGDMGFLQLAAGFILGRALVGILLVPAYFAGDLMTSYDLLRQRFGPAVKNLSAGLFIVTRSLADGIRLYATALVIAVVTGVPVTVLIVVLGVAMIVYTLRGGATAVIWTDVIQLFVYVLGAAVLVGSLLAHINGGWHAVVDAGMAAGKFTVIDATWNPNKIYTLWSGLIGGMILTLAVQGTDQFFVQRLLAARSRSAAAWGVFASGLVVFAQFALFLLIGIMLWVFYQQTPLPVPVDRADKIVSVYVLHNLGPGLAGLIIAAIVAAALSPSTNALAATTVNDFYKPYVRPDAPDSHLLRVSHVATVVWGLVQVIIALGAQYMRQGVLDAGLTVLGLSSGAVLGAFLIGTLRPSVSGNAVFAGMLTGIATVLAVWLGTPIAWTWHAMIGATVTVSVALIVAPFVPPSRPPVPAEAPA
ncbi:MAG: sodium/solute symporter [Vicinamibacteraceae bacterium]